MTVPRKYLPFLAMALLVFSCWSLVIGCSCGSPGDDGDVAQPPSAVDDDDDDTWPDDDTGDDDDTGPDDDDTTTTTTTTTTTQPTGTTVPTSTSTTTTTLPGDGSACRPFVEEPVVIERETPFGPWPTFEERGITFRQIISSGAGEGQNDVLVTGDGLVRVLAQDGRSLDVIAVGPEGEVSREVVDPRGGEWKSLGADAEDNLYAVYTVHSDVYPETYELRAATNKSGAWDRTVLFSSNDDGLIRFEIAVDAAGLVHMVYTGRDNSAAAHYATWDGDAFTDIEVAPSPGSWRYAEVIALDSQGSPHLLWGEQTGAWHWRLIDGVWTGELVRDNAYPWDLTIDADDVLHAGFSADAGHLVYGRNDGDFWIFEDLAACPDGQTFIGVNVDASGAVHISYTDGDLRNALYTTNESGAWMHTLLYEDDGFDHAWDVASSLDANGHIYIVHRRYNDYYYSRDSDLNLTSNAGGEWVRRRLIKGTRLSFTRGVLDSSDNLHFAFTRDTDQHLYYGKLSESSWTTEFIDASQTGLHGVFSPQIQLDSLGDIYIVYNFKLSETLDRTLISYQGQNQWVKEPVGEDAEGFTKPIFRIDGDDVFHIVHDRVEGQSRIHEYGRRSLDAWEFESVPISKAPNFIAIDSLSQPVLSYEGEVAGDDAIFVAKRDSDGSWNSALVDTATVPSYRRSVVAIGSDGRIRLGYQFQNDYRFAEEDSGLWDVTHMGLGVSGGSDLDFVLDESNHAHVAVYGANGSLAPEGTGIYYLRNTTGVWERFFVDGYIGSMKPVGIHIKSDDSILMYYYYYGVQALMAATFEPFE